MVVLLESFSNTTIEPLVYIVFQNGFDWWELIKVEWVCIDESAGTKLPKEIKKMTFKYDLKFVISVASVAAGNGESIYLFI